MDLRQLRYFLAVAEGENVTRAGARLGIAQSALSRQIAMLEHDLGAALFERHGRRLNLTAAGERLREPARRLLAEAEALRAVARRDTALPAEGHVSVGAPSSIGQSLFPRVARAAAIEAPGLRLEFHEALLDQLEAWLLDGTIDIAVLTAPVALPGLVISPLRREGVYVFGSEAMLRPLGRSCTPAAAFALPLIVPPRPDRERLTFEAMAARVGAGLLVAAETRSVALGMSLALLGKGAIILPFPALQLVAGEPGLRSRLRGHVFRRLLAWRAASAQAAPVLAMAKLLRREVLALPSDDARAGRPR
jgi:LysR family nitrogen assimilation transcriptional regulator